MDERITFEEKVGGALDALHTAALLLTRDDARAESLIIGVVGEASRSRSPAEHTAFRKWIVGRLMRRYVEHAKGRAPASDHMPGDGSRERRPPAEDELDLDLAPLVERLDSLHARDPDRLARVIRSTLEDLPLLERAAVWLVTVMGFTYAEAASSLQIQPAAVPRHIYRGRRELQSRLARALDAPSSSDAATTRPGDGSTGGRRA